MWRNGAIIYAAPLWGCKVAGTCTHASCNPNHNLLLSGIHSLLDDEAVTVGGNNHSHATKDL